MHELAGPLHDLLFSGADLGGGHRKDAAPDDRVVADLVGPVATDVDLATLADLDGHNVVSRDRWSD